MAVRELPGYCSFTKAVEHFGDRWSIFIVRRLGTAGPAGFNDLARSLPGRVSRSVLSERLRRLETLGLVSRQGTPRYGLTTAGAGLLPVLSALQSWADTWVPEDPAMLDRDPDVVLAWLARQVCTDALPPEPVVLELWVLGEERRYWLVVQPGAGASGCLADPMLDESRYLYVRSAPATLLALALGRLTWSKGIADGSVTVTGDAALRAGVPRWFTRTSPVPTG